MILMNKERNSGLSTYSNLQLYKIFFYSWVKSGLNIVYTIHKGLIIGALLVDLLIIFHLYYK